MATQKRPQRQRVGSMLDDALFYDQRIDTLSKEAFILLIEAVMLSNGYNNGDIALAQGTLRMKWRKQTLIKARQELVDKEFLNIEKRGHYGAPNLYSLTHKPVNDIPQKGIKGTKNARRRATGVHPRKKKRGT